ncbi:uncharacterized protein At3g27210-like [Typha angustifolia]|uniref:uncharacterized protein At3g27210-like n=1 Tax=Typha angustifolia TaxID=59011 RepID=UPI003C2B51E6
MKFRIGKGSKSKRSSISSTSKGRSFSEKNHDSGSKEESFFESQSRLDSDREEDFYSIHGESTPSTGSTPNNQTTSLKTIPNTQSGQSPPSDRIQKLAELLRENSEQIPRSSNVAPPYHSPTHSISSGEVSPKKYLKERREKQQKSTQCCMPSFGSSRSNKERKQKATTVE